MTQGIYSGYYSYSLTVNGKSTLIFVHRLVAITYLPNPDNLPYVDHIDNNKFNNHVSNLRWISHQQNTQSYYTNHAPKYGIYQYDTEGNLVKEWDSFEDILEANPTYRRDSVRNGLNGHVKTVYGFVWAYVVPRETKKQKEANPNEKFKQIPEFEGSDLRNYFITKKGTVKNANDMLMSTNINGRGYDTVTLRDKSTGTPKDRHYCIHRLVAYTYLENDDPENKTVVNHKDGNKLNNDVSNLEWVTQAENVIHAQGIKIEMIDIETDKVIKKFNSIKEADEFLKIPTNYNCLNKIYNGKGESNIAYGYKWKFIE